MKNVITSIVFMKTIIAIEDALWFYGFKLFYSLKHPSFGPFLFLRRIVRKILGSRHFLSDHELTPKSVPKKIYIFWAQGWDNAPLLCQLCRESWIINNPGWEVVPVTMNDFEKYVNLDYSLSGKNVSFTNYSNILRLAILSKDGGVWADPTTFCRTPLDAWLPFLMQTGFFAFSKQKTTIADWFLASEAGGFLMRQYEQYAYRYWKYANSEERYFWPHYLFEYLVQNNKRIKMLWNQTPHISSQGSYSVQKFLKQEGSDHEAAIPMLFDEDRPISKLDWRITVSDVWIEKVRSQLHKI
ncbi:hypothetical protein KBB27_02325 [Patescibacteria group bacterium]|nr:hypothetical protein [Patescibacteria group bacterium]